MDIEFSVAREYESYIFGNILTYAQMLNIKELGYPCAACDSSAIRAYSNFRRFTETDIDLIFPTFNDNAANIAEALSDMFSDNRQAKTMSNNCYFLRIYFRTPFDMEFSSEFLLDFHIGGYMHNNNLLIKASENYFKEIRWTRIKSLGGLESTIIPVPNIHELFIFKLSKFVGRDPIDIISLLLSESLSCDIIGKRLKAGEHSKLHINLHKLRKHLDTEYSRWCIYNYQPEEPELLDTINVKLNEILT